MEKIRCSVKPLLDALRLTSFAFLLTALTLGCTGEDEPTSLADLTYAGEDERFNEPHITVNEWRNEPVRHYFVHGEFKGTDARFSIYLPPKDQYERRFFQFVHQFSTSDASATHIRFAIDNGAYLVQTNMGGKEASRMAGVAAFSRDPTVTGYRVSASAAEFSRVVASSIFGDHRPYGYLAGGSGGSFLTISGLQNTTIWDGGVPYIMGSPVAIPNMFTPRIHALRILRDGEVNKFPDIMDAIDPGGSGDPFATLNEEQWEALEEVTRMGFPMRGWFDHETLTDGPLRWIFDTMFFLDTDYFTDFWERSGYLGYDDTYDLLAEAMILHDTTIDFIASVEEGPRVPQEGAWTVRLSPPPDGMSTNWTIAGASLVVKNGLGRGKRLPIFQIVGTDSIVVRGDASELAPGDQVTVDNRDHLALQTYYRHQIPDWDRYTELMAPKEYFPELPEIFPKMPAWDQFLDEDGDPTYPQRDVLVGPPSAFYVAGSLHSGHFHGKMIGVQTMMDIDAMPWNADWIRNQIREAGNGDRFRLYFIDHADHGINVQGHRQARLVSFRGALEQAILDLVAWVENGVEPPAETQYTMDGAQVILPPNASDRGGIQPIVHLSVNGGERADIRAGDQVRFQAEIQVPDNTGQIVNAEWDFYGVGEDGFERVELDSIRKDDPVLEATHTYTEPGTYFPVLRVSSHRKGDADTPHAQVQNLGRARVVVE